MYRCAFSFSRAACVCIYELLVFVKLDAKMTSQGRELRDVVPPLPRPVGRLSDYFSFCYWDRIFIVAGKVAMDSTKHQAHLYDMSNTKMPVETFEIDIQTAGINPMSPESV